MSCALCGDAGFVASASGPLRCPCIGSKPLYVVQMQLGGGGAHCFICDPHKRVNGVAGLPPASFVFVRRAKWRDIGTYDAWDAARLGNSAKPQTLAVCLNCITGIAGVVQTANPRAGFMVSARHMDDDYKPGSGSLIVTPDGEPH